MPGNRFDDRLSESDERAIAEAEADLERLLSIEPSPEFGAKVRMRIHADRTPSSRWFGRWQLGLAAASLVLVGIIVTVAVRKNVDNTTSSAPVFSSAQPAPVRAGRPEPRSERPPVGGPQDRPRALDGRVANSEPRVARREPGGASREPRRASREPEVLVPSDRKIALERFLLMARAGTVDDRLFPKEPLPAAAGDTNTPAVSPLVVDDLQVPALNVAAAGIEQPSARE
jgi:hypothetical protein